MFKGIPSLTHRQVCITLRWDRLHDATVRTVTAALCATGRPAPPSFQAGPSPAAPVGLSEFVPSPCWGTRLARCLRHAGPSPSPGRRAAVNSRTADTATLHSSPRGNFERVSGHVFYLNFIVVDSNYKPASPQVPVASAKSFPPAICRLSPTTPRQRRVHPNIVYTPTQESPPPRSSAHPPRAAPPALRFIPTILSPPVHPAPTQRPSFSTSRPSIPGTNPA